MPLGNLTSQFFANVYLNKLDQFIKHKLKVKYYIRYVDDFVILHKMKYKLIEYKSKIQSFLNNTLNIKLHPEKSKIIKLNHGTHFLGLRIFYYHKLLKKKNIRKFKRKLQDLNNKYNKHTIDYDKIYNFLEGWINYTKNSNSYKLTNKLLTEIRKKNSNEISTKEINRLLKIKNNNFLKRIYTFLPK